MKSLDRFGTPLRQVEAIISLEFDGEQPLTGTADIRQMQNGAIIFGVITAGNTLYQSQPTRLSGITTEGHKICSKGQVLLTQMSMSFVEGDSVGFAEGRIQRIDIGAPAPPSSSLQKCSLAIHNLRTLSAQRAKTLHIPIPPTKVCWFGVEATLTPLDSYADAAGALEAGSQHQATFNLTLRSLRSGRRSADSWVALARRICSFLSLQNLSSVWVSKMTMSSGAREWHRWISWASSPFTMDVKQFCDGIVELEDALKLSLSQGAKSAIEEWGGLISYFSDAVSVSRYMQMRALTAATLLDAVLNTYATERKIDKYLTSSQERKLSKTVKVAVDGWDIDAKVVDDDALEDIKSNLAGVGRVPFKRRLGRAVSELKLPSEVPIDEITSTRNALVHTGRFPKKMATDIRQQRLAYEKLVWVDVCLLFRLIGYKGHLRDFGSVIVR